MSITCDYFGLTKDGEKVLSFCIKNKKGEYVCILNRGGAIQSFCVKDKDSNLKDIVLGFNTVEEYENDSGYLGALVGRVANRIKDAKFTLNGKEYFLAPTENTNTLHGGIKGYSFLIWDNKIEDDKLILTLFSPDGDEGFPGNLNVKVTYSFTDDSVFRIDYEAVCDADTIVNLTNHAYFNLDGEGNVNNNYLFIDADYYIPIDKKMLPTGEIASVKGTSFDFTTMKKIGKDIDNDDIELKYGMGYDHNFVLKSEKNSIIAKSEKTGIKLSVSTSMPAVQFYSGNYLPERKGKYGETTPVRAGFCLETQFYPDSMSNPNFPSIVLNKGDVFKHYAEFKVN